MWISAGIVIVSVTIIIVVTATVLLTKRKQDLITTMKSDPTTTKYTIETASSVTTTPSIPYYGKENFSFLYILSYLDSLLHHFCYI